MIRQDEWKPSEGIELENNAEIAVKSMNNLLVVAGPGTGKTEMLAQRANYLFATELCYPPFNILAISFKKDSASNLKKRIVERSGETINSHFDSLTYDAFAKRILDQFRNGLDKAMQPNVDYLVQDEATLKEFVKKAYSKNRFTNRQIIDKWKSFSFISKSNDVNKNRLKGYMLKGVGSLKACLSYPGIMQLAILIVLKNPKIKAAFQAAYPFVFLDEFQDTTDLQYYLIKALFQDSHSIITAVGDDKQRIMVWAGARQTVFNDLKRDFSAADLVLKINHRSVPKLIDFQEKICSLLDLEPIETLGVMRAGYDKGEINLIEGQNEYEEAQLIVDDILGKTSSGVKPSDILILTKQKIDTYADNVIRILKTHQIKARVEMPYQDLLKEPLVQIILQTLQIALNIQSVDDWTEYLARYAEAKGISNDTDERLFYEIEEELEGFFQEINLFLHSEMLDSKVEKLVERIIEFWTASYFKLHFPQYLYGDTFLDVKMEFIKLFSNERENNADWSDTIDSFLGKDSISMMTIHKSKGLEADAVYIMGLDDNAFWSFEKDVAETRRIFFVAVSRAKRYLTFTFAKFRRDMGVQKHEIIQEFYNLIEPVANRITKLGLSDYFECLGDLDGGSFETAKGLYTLNLGMSTDSTGDVYLEIMDVQSDCLVDVMHDAYNDYAIDDDHPVAEKLILWNVLDFVEESVIRYESHIGKK